jgi:hypothetical protein
MEGKRRIVRIPLEVPSSGSKDFISKASNPFWERVEKKEAIKKMGNEDERRHMMALIERCKERGMIHSHAINPRRI